MHGGRSGRRGDSRCSTPDKVAFTQYGLEIAKYMLHYYDTYFGIPYPLKKLDLIGAAGL